MATTEPVTLKIKTNYQSFSDLYTECWLPGCNGRAEFAVTGQAVYRFGWQAAERNHTRIQRACATMNDIYGDAAQDVEMERAVWSEGGWPYDW